jgi:hypothetical protein
MRKDLLHSFKRRMCHKIKKRVMRMGGRRIRWIDNFIDRFVLKRFRENDLGTLRTRKKDRSRFYRNLRHISSPRNTTIGP